MEKTRIPKLWFIPLLVLISVNITNCAPRLQEELVLCDSLYHCPEGSYSPFTPGNIYFYSFNINSTLRVEKVVDKQLQNDDGQATTKSISQNGWLEISPITSCEIVILHRESKQPSWKVVFYNGTIHRICSSFPNPDSKTNMVKALMSLFQVHASSSIDLPAGFTIENDSMGNCLTKCVQCPNNESKYIKFKSRQLCSLKPDATIGNDLKLKIQHFENSIEKFSSNNDLCESPTVNLSSGERNQRKGIATCIIEKNSDGLITSSSCTEEDDSLEVSPIPVVQAQYYGSVSLKLGEILPKEGPSKDVPYYKTSIHQVDVQNEVEDAKSSEIEENFVSRLELILNDLTNATKRMTLNPPEIQRTITEFRGLIRGSNSENLVEYLEKQGNASGAGRSIKLFLSMLTLEASQESVLKFWTSVLANNSIQNWISNVELEYQIQKLLNMLSNLDPTVQIVEFCKFIVDYVDGTESGGLSNIKISALMTFTELLNRFCNRMQEKNGDPFCRTNPIIQEWVNSTMLKKIVDSSKHFDQIIALESFKNVKEHVKDVCEQVYDLGKPESLGLWTLLNCYRNEPCNSLSKDLFRKLLSDKSTRSNAKIASFLAMSKCFNDGDKEEIRKIFHERDPQDYELLNFIAQYKENREFYGRTEAVLNGVPEEYPLKISETKFRSTKITKGSNTFASIKIPTLPVQLTLETNMLYFDNPSFVPELVMLKLGTTTAANMDSGVHDKTMLEAEFYMDQLKSDSMLNYVITIVVRKFGRTVALKEISMTERKLFQLFHLIQLKAAEISQSNVSPETVLGKLYAIIRNAANMDIFKIMELPTRTKYIRTISGIPQRLQWNAEGFVGFTVEKQDCSDVLGDNQNDPTCQLEFKPVFNMETSLSLGIGYPKAKHFSQEGFILQSNLSAELPLSLRLSRSTSNKENFIELVLPPLKKAFVKGGVQVLDMEASADSIVQWNYKISLDGAHGPSSCPYSVDTDSNPVKIVLARNFERKALSLQVSDLQYEAVVELQSDPLYSIHGNLSYSPVVGSEPIRLYHFEVGAKNSDDVKRLQMKVSKRGHESSLDVYYIRKLQSVEGATTSQAWSCRAERRTGILCSWPFCVFCGEEYFIGATISTPRWKNIQLLEGSVSQVFPDQRIDIILKTTGIHPLHKAHFKTSITRAENTSSIHSPTLRVQVEKKLSEHKINETIQTDEENGGKWSFYSLSSEVFTELYGAAGASGIFVYSRGVSRFLDMYGGELSYPSRSSQQKITCLTTMYNPNETNANVTNSYIAETTFRSTQFPILDSDSKIYSRTINSHSKKVLYAIRLINLTKGDIKLETLNSVNKDDATNSWVNFHVDQTYKLFLPEGFLHRFIKARIALERIEQVIHEAALEVSVGVGQNGLEIRYDHIPDEDNALEILTSVTTSGDTYGLHHRLEPVRDAPGIGTNGDTDTAHAESMKFKYKGTYMFEDSSMKATGIFVARSGREILPFSKFDIRVSAVDGTDLGIRIFGAETIQPETNTHNIKMNVQKGEIKVFEFKNEINPADEVPIKGTIYLKDYGEANFFDNTKVSNRRNLQVKVKWPSKERLIQGRISFPTSLEEPLYLDLDVLVVSEVNEETVMKLTSTSTIGFYNFQDELKNFSVSTKNVMELKNQKWEAGLECVFVKETLNYYDRTSIKKFYRKSNYTLLTYYIPPGLQRYLMEIQSHDYSARQKESYSYLFKAERPDVTPLHIQLGLESDEKYKSIISYTDDHPEIERSSTSVLNKVSSLKVCHKDNFLYIFPKLEIDLFVQNFIQMEQNYTNYHSGHNEFTNIGKVGCSSVGIYLPLCNEINMSYKFNSEHADYYEGPWVANMTIENDNKNSDIDSLNLKLQANYETVREERKTTEDNNYGDFNMVTVFLSTVRADQLMKDSYNLDYNLRSRSADGENVNTKLVNGTYVFTKMFESLDFFEFSDEHQWSQLDNGNLYIWTNLVNHTTDINQTSESATFSSQYVSLGEEESSNNITWMQLRSTLDSNGFGLLKNIILQPTAFLNTYEGTVNADFLIKTEFSPVKTFRVLLSHDHNKSENEDDESSKYDTLSKLNVILNEREISCTNSLTAADGKIVGIGNTFNGECRSVDGVYEYVTVKTFVVCPKNVLDTSEDNLVHVDVSSSWTNEDDDDTDIRISNDIIYGPTTNGVMMARLAYFENSSEVDVGRNGSIFIYQNVANMEMTRELRLTETVISDSLNVLSFTQTSLQGISQQIVDDYFNVTNLNEVQTSDTTESGQVWVDYNIDVRSNIVNQVNSSNSHFKAKWLGFEERLFHCQSFYQTCSDNGINSTDNQIDTSNYCNLAIFPAKHVLYTV